MPGGDEVDAVVMGGAYWDEWLLSGSRSISVIERESITGSACLLS